MNKTEYTLKRGESIRIGDVRVSAWKDPRGGARVAIDAPRGVRVLRAELAAKEKGVNAARRG